MTTTSVNRVADYPSLKLVNPSLDLLNSSLNLVNLSFDLLNTAFFNVSQNGTASVKLIRFISEFSEYGILNVKITPAQMAPVTGMPRSSA